MTNFDDNEVQMLILALRFWRARRRDGVMRRTDPAIPPQTVEGLLAKLEAKRISICPPRVPDDPLDPFHDLFSR
jgi:hypothetical protein